jgi:chromosomal replication initiation ATPase DnaA
MRPAPAERQLALDLPHVAATALHDFMPAASNRGALDAVLAWPEWPAPALALDGPSGCGKTHLARIWAARAGALFLPAAEIWQAADPLARLGEARACVIDDADAIEDERLLLHLYNLVIERRGSLLLTAREPVSAWGIALPDLRSRLLTAWRIGIGIPDEGLLAALLVKQLSDRQLRIEPGVVELLTRNMERSFAAAAAVSRELDRLALCTRRPLGVALARSVLRRLSERQIDEDRPSASGVNR